MATFPGVVKRPNGMPRYALMKFAQKERCASIDPPYAVRVPGVMGTIQESDVATSPEPRSAASIAGALSGRSVLLSGATGFLAKAMAAKMLTSFDEGVLYLLIRAASRPEARSRLHREILDSRAFAPLRRQWGSAFSERCSQRIVAIPCDFNRRDLGLTREDRREIGRDVEVVVNSAASVDFHAPLDEAVATNVDAPLALLDIARDLDARFIQISTCYVCGLVSGSVAESLRPPPAGGPDRAPFDVQDEIRRARDAAAALVSTDDPEADHAVAVALARRHANERGFADVYSFTKFLGEHAISTARGDVPTIIVRPSIVESGLRDPHPGWLEGFRMLDPLILAQGEGRLMGFPIKGESVLDIIPVDYVVNATLAATARSLFESPRLRIYQVASSARRPLEVAEIARHLVAHFEAHPLRDDAGRPIRSRAVKLQDPRTFRRRLALRYEWPVKIGSAIFRRRLPIPGANRIRRSLRKARAALRSTMSYVDTYGSYCGLDLRFEATNTVELWNSLSEDDRASFPFDAASLDWGRYFREIHIPGLFRMLAAEGVTASPAAQST